MNKNPERDEMITACMASFQFCQILRKIHQEGHLLPTSSDMLRMQFETALDVAEGHCRKVLENSYGQAIGPLNSQHH
jgi:hypothetical protein